MAEKKELSKKELLALKKKRAALKKKKELEEQKKKSLGKNLITDEERIQISKDLKANAIATFAQFNFYKDGYKKSLGILTFTSLTLLVSFFALIYSVFIYQAPPSFIPVDGSKKIMINYDLKEAVYSDKEIIDYASEVYRKVSAYNYVTLRNGAYFSDIYGYFTSGSFKNYKEAFLASTESTYVQKNSFIVSSTQLNGARINKKESDELSQKVGKKLWVVDLNLVKFYQNDKNYIARQYKTKVKIMRVPNTSNEKGIAVQSIVDKLVKEGK